MCKGEVGRRPTGDECGITGFIIGIAALAFWFATQHVRIV